MSHHEHANIPIFIPHLGCPNDCVFCNQRTISGHMSFDPSTVRTEIETSLETLGGREAEIAFFGGSFTGIDRELMIYLLDLAQEYVDAGRVVGIRLSTRPDYINTDILSILSRYTVAAVELGIQSTSNAVLTASRRGHTAEVSESACRAVVESGFNLVGQMMIGLPTATLESELLTADSIVKWGAVAARVYPTVVFRRTELCRMAEAGDYTPLDTETAVRRTAAVLDVFDKSSVKVIRVGLCASENLASDDEVAGGANHPAIGELAMSELYLIRISDAIEKGSFAGERVILSVGVGSTSKAIGQKKRNIIALREKYGVNIVKVLEKNEIFGYNVKLEKC